MQIAIVGLASAGKTTVFNTLTRGHAETGGFGGMQLNVGVVKDSVLQIDFFEKSNTERQINVINSILINDIEVLTEDESNYLNYCITGYIDYVASILSNAYLIPLNQISIINKGQIEQNFFELSNDKYLKKI